MNRPHLLSLGGERRGKQESGCCVEKAATADHSIT
jgi:hypothetical protein